MPLDIEKIIEDDDFIIYSTKTLQTFSINSFNELKTNKTKILNFFGLREFRKVSVMFFDNKTEFRNYVLNNRTLESPLPDYAISVFDNGVIMSYIDLESIKDINIFNFKSKGSVHELVHIINKEKIYKKRITWLDEGLAMYLDNKKEELNDEENFNNFFINKILSIKILPNMNDLIHGNSFCNDDYNGYDLSYLCVRYLMENTDNLEKIIRDYDLGLEIGKTVLQDAINYYKNKINNNIIR